MKWIVQAAPQDVGAFNWDALSAIGTTLAALVALVIWLLDRLARRRERIANARLLANLLLPTLVNIAGRLGPTEKEFWNADANGPQVHNEQEKDSRFAELSHYPQELSALIDWHIANLPVEKFDLSVEKIGIFDPETSDVICTMLYESHHFLGIARDLKETASPEARYSMLPRYFTGYLRAAKAVKAALDELIDIAD